MKKAMRRTNDLAADKMANTDVPDMIANLTNKSLNCVDNEHEMKLMETFCYSSSYKPILTKLKENETIPFVYHRNTDPPSKQWILAKLWKHLYVRTQGFNKANHYWFY